MSALIASQLVFIRRSSSFDLYQPKEISSEGPWITGRWREIRGEKMSVCRWLIQARIRKRKVMEDVGIHPLLPIHKHDLWMILCWESQEVRSAFGVCHRDSVGSVNTHCSRVCACVCDRVFWIEPKDLKVSRPCLLFMHKVCVQSGIELFLLFSFVKSHQIRAALRFGSHSSHGKLVSVSGFVWLRLTFSLAYLFFIIFSCRDKAADKTLQTDTTDLGFSILWSNKGSDMRENTVMRYFVRQGSTTPNITRNGLILPPHFLCNWAKLPPDTSQESCLSFYIRGTIGTNIPAVISLPLSGRNRKEIFDRQRSWTLCRSVTEPVGSLLPVDLLKAELTRPPAHPTTPTSHIKHRCTHLDDFWWPILTFDWKSWCGLWNIE